MKKLIAFCMVVLLVGVFGIAYSADNVYQTVIYEVQAVNEIDVSSNPGALISSSATKLIFSKEVKHVTYSIKIGK